MDVKGSEWNYEPKLIRMWVGYMWKNPGCFVLDHKTQSFYAYDNILILCSNFFSILL